MKLHKHFFLGGEGGYNLPLIKMRVNGENMHQLELLNRVYPHRRYVKNKINIFLEKLSKGAFLEVLAFLTDHAPNVRKYLFRYKH